MKIYGFFFLFLIPLLHFSQPNTEVFLFDLNSTNGKLELSNFKNISNNEGYDNQPSFLDDSTILFASTRNGQTDILEYTISNGNKKWLCNTEGGEYSPLKIPNQNAISAIRLDTDGKQLLYRYDIETGMSKPLMDTLVVGYHAWFDKNTIVSSVLEGDILSVYVSNLETHKNRKMDENVGRSLHKIPKSNLVSYISKKTTIWTINALNPLSGDIKFIANTLPKTEDMVWLNATTILMGKGNKIYKFNIKTDTNWVELASLQDNNINNITRLALSHNRKKLAVVGEL